MEKKYYSEAAAAIHESAQALFEVGAISEAEMKHFDERCFVQESETAPKADKPTKPQPQSQASA